MAQRPLVDGKAEGMTKLVIWGAGRASYEVLTFEDGECVDEYTGGNSPWESQSYLRPDDPRALPLETMRRYAESTARETAEEVGAEYGGEDEDTTNNLLEDDALYFEEE